MFDDDHGAVFEVADTLVVGFAGLDDFDGHEFAGEDDGSHGFGE